MVTDVEGEAVRRPRAYHHGNLASALTEAAVTLARAGGPEAVVLREAARRVGVSPTAAYRHFPAHHGLLEAARSRAHEALAEALQQSPAEAGGPAAKHTDEPLGRLRSLVTAYIRFAVAEPGLFRTAFCRAERSAFSDAAAGNRGRPPDESLAWFRPFQTVCDAVDALIGARLLPADRRTDAALAAWSAAHGLAVLILDGPLRDLDREERERAVRRLVQVVVHGLVAGE